MKSESSGRDGCRSILTPDVEIIGDEFKCSMVARPLKRMAIIDTCNVVHEAAKECWKTGSQRKSPSDKPKPDAIGVMLVVKALLSEGFDCRLLVPNCYMDEQLTQNAFILKALKELGLLVPIDEGSHDDLVLLELAKTVGGFVISNDKYRDHTAEHLKATIQTRRCGFCFDALHQPEPQSYQDFLADRENRFTPAVRLVLAPVSFDTMFAQLGDATYDIVFQTRLTTSQQRMSRALDLLDVCADYTQRLACLQMGVQPPALDYCGPNEGGSFEQFRDLFNRCKRS